MDLTLRLLAGEPAWCAQGTHVIDPNGRVVFVQEDCDVTFVDERAFRHAEKMLGERRARMGSAAPVELPPAGPVGSGVAPPKSPTEDLKNTVAALLARIEDIERTRGGG